MKKKLSLGIVVGSISRNAGGLFYSVRNCAQELLKLGVDIEVYALEDEYSEQDVESWHPLVPRIFETNGHSSFGYSSKMSKAISRSSHDILHQHGIWQCFSASVCNWQRQSGKPVVISPRGMLDKWAIESSSWRKTLASSLYERRNMESASCVHALNIEEEKSIKQWCKLSNTVVIPNGVCIPTSEVAFPLPVSDNKTKTILFLGRLHPKKGLLALIEAWALVVQTSPYIASQWRLVIAGWGEGNYENTLIARAHSLGMTEHIHFNGPVYGEEKMKLLRSSSAFILPSFSEGMPMSVLEAWSLKLPVFMTKECNLSEGFSLNAAIEISNLSADIAKVLCDNLGNENLVTVGRSGYELVSKKFVWPVVASQFLNMYNNETRTII